ncbi:MAG TPA: hypothetical protein VGV88_14830 [Candidatus Dormibacteraeota bacterium]|nr:hypothetical protein [Candidatus Dormibacteraeota bacterium]
MGGSALGKLWDTHPRLAFALHLAACMLLAGLLIQALVKGYEWDIDLIVSAGLLAMSVTLVIFTREALQIGWSRSDY